jgi:6-pyruvoyltetrahydropterin/6-carboxytetrahydropterin synthase
LKAELSQSFIFDAAHTLKRSVPVEEYEASARMHGHTYTAEIVLRGELGESGMIEVPRAGKHGPLKLDLFELRAAIAKVRGKLDHQLLNDVEGLGAPTMENLCKFIGTQIRTRHELPVSAVTVARATGDKCRLEFDPLPEPKRRIAISASASAACK